MDKQTILESFNGNFISFYSKFCGELQRAGKEYKACCPFHQEKHPSLSISPDTGIFYCFGCGAKGDIFTFYGKHRGLSDFPAILSGLASDFGISDNGTKPPIPNNPGKLIKRYAYHGPDGAALFYKNRFDPKGFSISRPDGKGGFVSGMGGVKPVPYNLPAVLKADIVWLAEGEKDADKLNDLEYTATTNFDGAGKWRDSYNPFFKGKHIVLVPDQDDQGRAHAQKVAAALHGVAASIKIITLPNPAGKKGFDVSDFIAEMADPEAAAKRLAIMAEAAVEWTPPAESKGQICESVPAGSYHLTDTGNGQRFADHHRDNVKYCFPVNRFFVWDGTRWKSDSEGIVRRLAKDTTRKIYAEAATEPDPEKSQKIGKWAAASESSFRQEAMLKMAQSEPGIPILPEQMDTNRWLLNVQNGTIDLKTGVLLPHHKSDLITKIAPVAYDPDATCPRWLEFLDTIMDGDDEMVNYLCRVAGYSLTGDAGEQCLFVCHGNGQNGKSTYLNVKQSILEDYALQTGFDTFTIKKNEGIRNDIARMRTARLVVAIETGDGKRLDEQVVKQLTGGDKVTARFLHQEHFEFRPQFKVFLAANQKPTIYGQDFAIWRRVKLIPFDVKIPQEKRINNYERVLLEEKQGILNWMVFGCLEWQRIGLADPEKVKMATDEYRSEMDVLEDFLNSYCMVGDGFKTKHSLLYAAYEGWCQGAKETAFKTRTFAKMLQSRGFTYSKPFNIKTWHGIGIRA